jgi:putative DNA primase/helicase
VNLPATTSISNAGEDRDPFADSAEDIAAEETREKAELFAWADSVLGLGEAELELALTAAVKRFGKKRAELLRIVKARKHDKKKESDRTRSQPEEDRPEDNVRYYGDAFKVSNRGVFARGVDNEGNTVWRQISSTPIDPLALTRDTRRENWGTYVRIVNRDGEEKKIAIPHALIAANKAADIAALLASLGVGVVANKEARHALLEFLMPDLKERITAVPQIGWHPTGNIWVFVLPDETIVPAGFDGPRPVLQTASLQLQHGFDVSGTVEEWIEKVAAPLAGNSNIHLSVGIAFAGPLLKFANEPPGIFHQVGSSKIGKSLVGAIGQSVWGRAKVPGEADAFGASWNATAVGLERYAVLRSDVGAYFDEIGEGSPQTIRSAIYMLANGSTKLHGTRDINLRRMAQSAITTMCAGQGEARPGRLSELAFGALSRGLCRRPGTASRGPCQNFNRSRACPKVLDRCAPRRN